MCSWQSASPNPLLGFNLIANPFPSGFWLDVICGPGQNCPAGIGQEGTPDIFMKQDGGYYMSFHGVDPSLTYSIRAMTVTADFISSWAAGPYGPLYGIPDGAWLDRRDTYTWNQQYPFGSFVGPADATTLVDPRSAYDYTALETSSISLGCVPGQLWQGAFVRSLAAAGLPLAGGSEPYPRNPIFTVPTLRGVGACPAGYVRIARDLSGAIYLSYMFDINWAGVDAVWQARIYRLEAGSGAALQPDALSADQTPAAWGTL
jgi:hypothetical protein